jgi:hypothetical protein
MAVRILLCLFLAFSLSGCFLPFNDISQLEEGELFWVGSDRGLVVVGVATEQPYPRFGVSIEEAVGPNQPQSSCVRHNQMKIYLARPTTTVQYFVFSATPDFYVVANSGLDVSFVVKPGRAVYLGNLVFNRQGKWELRQDIDAARKAASKILGAYALEPAETAPPRRVPFICILAP